MTRRLVITGVEGFVGRHVARLAASAGFDDVIGIGRHSASGIPGVKEYFSADLAQGWPNVGDVDAVIHLAGLSAVGPSFGEPRRYIDTNAAITINLCEALLEENQAARLIVASTGALYRPSGSPIDEDAPTIFSSPYAISKATMENLLSYYAGRGLDAAVARPFNHIGPGQGPGFIVPDLINRLQGLASGDTLVAGNLDAQRDYTDVRDVAAAYLKLATAELLTHRLFNIASGTSRSGWEVLEQICVAMQREVPKVSVTQGRPLDPTRIVGNATRLSRNLDWTRQYDFEKSIADAVGNSRAA